MREQARASRRGLEEVRELLLHPRAENVNRSRAVLLRCIAALQQVRGHVRAGGEVGLEARLDMEQSARLGRQISLLLHHGWGVQLEWGRQLLGTGEAYGADGSEARLAVAGRMRVAG